MRIIDATWEKRNLGVTCYEIEFSDDDKISDIESNRDKFFERQYVVLKVPEYPRRYFRINRSVQILSKKARMVLFGWMNRPLYLSLINITVNQ